MKVLFLMQLYPPVHGASATGENIKNSKIINSEFTCDYVRLSTLPTRGKNSPLKQIVNLIRLYTEAIKILRKNKYDLIYITPCSSGFAPFYKDFGLCMIAKLYNKRIIYHFHDKGISKNKYVPSFIMKRFFKNVIVILSSPLLYYDIEKYVPHENVHYCAYGIPDEDRSRDFKREYNGKVVILFLAHMLRVKGVFDLLEACAILHARGIEFDCNFVGSWYDIDANDFFAFLKKNDLEEKVHFLGPQYGSDKNKAFATSDIFCLPTFYPLECFPLVILEAMRWNLPVVTTSEGAISEIIDDEKVGYIVDRHDPQALANRLESLIKNRETRIAMGQAGRSKFESTYTIEKFENRILQIFNKVLIDL